MPIRKIGTGARFRQDEWTKYQEDGQKYPSFDRDITSGYIRFGVCGLSVYKYHQGRWFRKYIPEWRKKTLQEANACLHGQNWEEKNSKQTSQGQATARLRQ